MSRSPYLGSQSGSPSGALVPATGEDCSLTLFGNSLGRGTKGLGQGTDDRSGSPDGSAALVSADAAIHEFRSKTLQRWLELKERQIASDARRRAQESEDGGTRFVRKAVPHDWTVLARKASPLPTKVGDRKRQTLQERMSERREAAEELMRKTREADKAVLQRSFEAKRADEDRFRDEQDGFRKWATSRRQQVLTINHRRKELQTEQCRRQRQREREMVLKEREAELTQRQSELQARRQHLRSHRECRGVVVQKAVVTKHDLVRALRKRQKDKESEKATRERSHTETVRDRLGRERKELRERREKDRDRTLEDAQNYCLKIRKGREELHQLQRESQQRDSDRLKEAWREQYVELYFPPDVVQSARRRMRHEHGDWRRLPWDEQLRTLRAERERLRPAGSPLSGRYARTPATSPARQRCQPERAALPPRPGSAPPGPTGRAFSSGSGDGGLG